VRRRGLDSSDSVQGLVAVSCEHGNETWGSIKGREFVRVTINFCRRVLLHGVNLFDVLRFL
jgi:hypothetical protein